MARPAAPLVVFDLDDTLYLERDFALSGYRAAAALLAHEPAARDFAAICTALLDAGERTRIFDRALGRCGLPHEPDLVARLVAAYRSHRPEIRLAPDAERFLAARPLVVAALVTDGPAETQEAKIAALGIAPRLGCILCTGRLGAGFGKPHPRAFEMIEAWAAPHGRPLVYVADNPVKDFVTPKARGWRTVQIERPERVHRLPPRDALHAADASIVTLDALDACLDRLH